MICNPAVDFTQCFNMELLDPHNLAYMSPPSKSPKIERWKLSNARFSYTTIPVDGEIHYVADGMTRLMGLFKVSYLMGIKEVYAKTLSEVHGGIAGLRGYDATLLKLRSCATTGKIWRRT